MPLLNPFAYLVILDAKTAGLDYTRFITELQTSDDWWRYISNAWIVLRRDSLSELQTKLVPLIGNQDRLLIVPAKGPAVGWLPQEAWVWLNTKLPREF